MSQNDHGGPGLGGANGGGAGRASNLRRRPASLLARAGRALIGIWRPSDEPSEYPRALGRARSLGSSWFDALEPRQMLAAVAWDGGGALDNWEDPLNWDTDVVPGIADDVTIDIAGSPTITYSNATGNRTVNSLVCREAVAFNINSTLGLTVLTTVELDATWTMQQGTLTGGTWDVSGGLIVMNGGGAGTQRIFTNVTVLGEVRALSTGTMIFNGGSFDTLRIATSGASVGMLFGDGTTVTGDIISETTGGSTAHSIRAAGATATVTLAASCEVRTAAGSTAHIEFDVGDSNDLTLINNGTIRNESSTRAVTIGTADMPSFTNNGTVEVTAGTLTIAAASWSNTGNVVASGTSTLNIGGAVATGNLNLPGWSIASTATPNLLGAIDNASATLALAANTGNWILGIGASIVGGDVTYAGGAFLRVGGGGTPARLADVTIAGDLMANIGNGVVRLGIGARFTTLRLIGSANVTVGFEPGYVLEDDIVGEAAGGGAQHGLQMTANGTLTISPTGSVRVVSGAGKRIDIGGTGTSFSGAMTLVNQGLISAEQAIFGQTIIVMALSFTNEGTVQVSVGEVEVQSTTWSNAAAGTISATGGLMDLRGGWSNAGTISAAGGTSDLLGTWSNTGTLSVSGVSTILSLGGIWNATGGIGTWTRSGGTVNITGTINNAGATIAMGDTTTGSWVVSGGTILGGTITQSGGVAVLAGESQNSTLDGVTVMGEIRMAPGMSTASRYIRLVNGTTFDTLRFDAISSTGACVVGFSPGSIVTGDIIGESAGTVFASAEIGLISAGTLTIAPGSEVRLVSASSAGMTLGTNLFGFNSAMTLINQGIISAESSLRTLTIQAASFANQGLIETTAGTLTNAATAWSNSGAIDVQGGIVNLGGTWNATGGIGTWTRSGGTVNITGTINNAAGSFTMAAATTGTWVLNPASTISGGTITTGAGAVITAAGSTFATLDGVTLNGEVHLGGAGSAVIRFINGSSFTTLRYNSTGTGTSSAGFSPGTVITGDIIVESTNAGAVNELGITGAGTLTIDAGAEVRIASGAGTGFRFGATATGFTGALTLVNNGLISSDAASRTLTIGTLLTGFTNNGTLQTTNAAAILVVSAPAWENDGQILCPAGRIEIGGTLNNTTSTGTINPTGGTIRFLGTVTNTASTISFVGGSTGTIELATCTINGGTITLPSTTANNATALLNVNGGVTLNGILNLPGANTTIRITGGLTVNGTVTVFQFSSGLIFNGGTQSLNGSGTVALAQISCFLSADNGAVVTIGSGVTISGFGNIRQGALNGTGGFINQGTITAGTSGQTLTISTLTLGFSNTGLAQAVGGGTLALAGTITTAQLGDIRNVSGTVRINGTIDNTAATLTLNATTGSWAAGGGTIAGGAVNLTGGSTLLFNGLGSLSLTGGVSLNGDVNIPAANTSLRITGGLTYTGTLTVGQFSSGIIFDGGAQTLGGAGTFALGQGACYFSADNGAVVTISPGMTISGFGNIRQGALGGTGGFINQGTVRAGTSGSTLTIGTSGLALGFANQGTMEAAGGGILSFPAALVGLTNTGLIRAATGGIVNLTASLTTAALGDLRNVSGTVNILGTINNAGDSIDLNSITGIWTIGPLSSLFGTINGGTINASPGFEPSINLAQFTSGVTYNGNLAIVGSVPHMKITGGLTLNGTLTISSIGRGLFFDGGTQTMSGTALVTLTQANANFAPVNNCALTIASTVTIRGVGNIVAGTLIGGRGSLVNNGVISGDGSTGIGMGNFTSLTNNGTFEAINGGRISINGTSTDLITNISAGTLSGGIWRVQGTSALITWNPGPAITTNAATIILDGATTSFTHLSTLAANSGSLTLANGRAFDFAPAGNNFANSGTFIKSGTDTTTVGVGITFNNTGTISVTGGTLTLSGPVSQISGSTLTGGDWVVENAALVIPGANLTTNQASVSLGGTAVFAAIDNLATNQGAFIVYNGHARVLASLTNTSAGVVNLSGGASLTVSLAMNNAGLVNADDLADYIASGGGTHSGTFNLSGGGEVHFGGTHTITGADFLGSGTFHNTGTLIQSGANSGFGNNPDNLCFSSTGTVLANVGTLTIDAEIAQLFGSTLTGGFWEVAATGALDLVGASITTIGAGAEVRLRGDGAYEAFGAISTGGGLAANAGGLCFLDGEMVTLPSLNNSGLLTVENGSVLTITGNFTSTGTVQVVDATLNASGGGSHTDGAWTIDGAGASINLAGSHSLSGAGSSVSGSGTFVNNGVFSMGNGTSPIGSGGIGTVRNNGTWNYDSAFMLAAAAFDNFGNVASSLSGATILTVNSTIITNKPGANFNVNGNNTSMSHGGGSPAFNNQGTLTRNGINGYTLFIPLNNLPGGTVNVAAAALTLFGGGTGSGLFTGGTNPFFTPHLIFGSGYDYATGCVISGPLEALSFVGTQLFDVPNMIQSTGQINLSGTLMDFAAPQSIGGTAAFNGTLTGSADVTFTNIFNWGAGNAEPGVGRVIVAAACTSTWMGGNRTINGRTVENFGIINHNANIGINVVGGASIVNKPGAIYNSLGDNDFEANAVLGGGTFINQGTLNKSGAGTTLRFRTNGGFGVSLDNPGAVNITAGHLNIIHACAQVSGNSLTAGSWTVAGQLSFPAGSNVTSLAAPAIVTLDGPSANVAASLSSLATNAGSLTVKNAAPWGFITSGTFTNTGTFNTAGTGTVTVPVAVTFSNTGTLTIGSDLRGPGGGLDLGGPIIGGGVINIRATLTLDADSTFMGQVNHFPTGTRDGAAIWTVIGTYNWFGGAMSGTGRTRVGSGNTLNMVEGVMQITGGHTLENLDEGIWTGGCLALNAGTFINGLTANFTINGPTEVVSQGGANAFINEGDLIIDDGADTDFGGGVAYSNSGFTSIAAPVTFDADTVFDGNVSLIEGGDLNGPGHLTFNAIFEWVTGSLSGPGTVTVSTLGSLVMPGPDDKFLSTTFNHDAVGGIWTGGCLALANGIFNNNTGAELTIDAGEGNMVDVNGLSGINFFNNHGLITVLTGTLNINVPGVNTGIIDVISDDTLILNSSRTWDSSGDLVGVGRVVFLNGTHFFPAGTFGITGSVGFLGGDVSINDQLNLTGPVSLSQPTTFNADATFTTLTINADISGAGTITVTQLLNWQQGALSGSGHLVLPAGSILLLLGTGPMTLSKVLDLSGNAQHDAGTLTFDGGTLNALAGSTFDAANSVGGGGLASAGAGGMFNNAGTFSRAVPAPYLFGVNLNNQTGGVFNITTADIALIGNVLNAGTINLAAGRVLSITGTFTNQTGGAITTQVGGAAANQVGRITATGSVTLGGGSLGVTYVNAYAPAVGDQLQLITGATVGGTFTSVGFPPPAANLRSTLLYNPGDVTLRTTALADWNGDGSVNVPDIFAFLASWFGGSADVNNDGNTNVPDIFAFLAFWFQG